MFGSTQTDDSRDEERIQTQMILDVEAFGKEAQFLGIETEKNEHYAILKNIILAHDRMFFSPSWLTVFIDIIFRRCIINFSCFDPF